LILCALMNLTISAPSIKLSISMLFRILNILSILTGPNIFLNIYLSKMRRFFSSLAFKVQVSDKHVTTGLIIVLYILILVFFFRSFNFISFSRIISILNNTRIKGEKNWLKYTYRHVCCHEDKFNKKNAVWSLPENEKSLC
jgi:hypothetical protein